MHENAMRSVDMTMFYLPLILLFLSVSSALGQETRSAGKGIDARVIAAYKKVTANDRAMYGGWSKGENGWSFDEGEEAAKKGLPGLFFSNGEPKAMPPDAGVPFGLAYVPTTDALIWPVGPFSDAGLKHLSGLKNLALLQIWGSRVTDEGLKELTVHKNLSVLSLGTTDVTDKGMKELARLKSLTELHLGSTNVTDAGVKELAALKKLSVLDLFHTQVTGAGLKGFKDLELIDLRYTKLTDAGLRELTGLKKLSTLLLTGTGVDDESLKIIGQIKSLTTLDLTSRPVTDTGLKNLTGLGNLKTLYLNGTKVTDAGVAAMNTALPKCKIEKEKRDRDSN
jgi:hypothetical protein